MLRWGTLGEKQVEGRKQEPAIRHVQSEVPSRHPGEEAKEATEKTKLEAGEGIGAGEIKPED